MILVAVTGSIGAGKSTLVHALAARGMRRIDADQLARDVVDPRHPAAAPTLAAVRALLGSEAFTADGGLDRDEVARRIFADAELRAAYEGILHPAISAATVRAIRDLYASEPHALVIHEIPLLRDRDNVPWIYDLVVTVEADPAVRENRLVTGRGHSSEHARARIAAQLPESHRTALSDIVVRTDSPLSDTAIQADAIWARAVRAPRRQAMPLR